MNDLQKYLLSQNSRPNWLVYPHELEEGILKKKFDTPPWRILTVEDVESVRTGLLERYNRDLVPFAHRQTNDDVACFERGSADRVHIIDCYTDPGREDVACYGSISDWFHEVERDQEDWVD